MGSRRRAGGTDYRVFMAMGNNDESDLMRVCFIQATNDENAAFSAPLWPAYLRAYAEQYVEADWYVAHSEQDLWRIKPDVVAISAMSQDWDAVPGLVNASRSIGACVAVGGHHVTGTGLDSETVGFGYCNGPGEDWFVDWLMELPYQKLIKRLDDIPMPDHTFGILPGQKPTILTSRGCSFSCSFCSPKLMWDKIQFHSARRVVDEIKQIQRDFPGMRRLSIWDDLFAAKQSRVWDICRLLESDGVRVRLNASMRSELVSHDNCRLWKRIGLTRLGIGGESGSNRILKQLKGPAASVEKNQRALDIMHDHGMAVGTGIILGSPGETEDDVRLTYEWLLDNYRKGKLMNHAVNILTPLPGTPVWAQAVKTGHVADEGFTWSRLKHIGTSPGKHREWMAARRDDDSIYLNEDALPQETLYEMIDHYERKIKWCSPAQVYRWGRRKLEKVAFG